MLRVRGGPAGEHKRPARGPLVPLPGFRHVPASSRLVVSGAAPTGQCSDVRLSRALSRDGPLPLGAQQIARRLLAGPLGDACPSACAPERARVPGRAWGGRSRPWRGRSSQTVHPGYYGDGDQPGRMDDEIRGTADAGIWLRRCAPECFGSGHRS